MSETIKSTDKCPCGSGKTYAECCEPLITGKSKALTAEALMRARYTAYVVHAIDFIMSRKYYGSSSFMEKCDKKYTWSVKSNCKEAWDIFNAMRYSEDGGFTEFYKNISIMNIFI